MLQLPINNDFNNDESTEDVDIGILINQWLSIHQENKQLLQQFTQNFSASLSNNRDSFSNFGDVLLENVSINDNKCESIDFRIQQINPDLFF